MKRVKPVPQIPAITTMGGAAGYAPRAGGGGPWGGGGDWGAGVERLNN